MVAEGIVARVPDETLQTMYGTPPFKDAMELLTMISLLRGKLGKGGKPDITATAISIVHDWNVGKIPFFTVPPAVHPSMISREAKEVPPSAEDDDMDADEGQDKSAAAAEYASTSIVQSWSKPFDLAGLWDAGDEAFMNENDDDDGDMQVEEEEDVSSFVPDEAPEDVMEHDAHATQSTTDSRPASPSKTRVPGAGGRAKQNEPSCVAVTRERRPPKQPKERTQRLAPSGGADEELSMSTMNPLGRKNLKADAKRRRKEMAKFLGEEDVEIAVEG